MRKRKVIILENYSKRTILSLLLILLAVGKAEAEQLAKHPKLVLNIVVDELRSDYLSLLWNAFSTNGIRRLIEGGITVEEIDFDYTNVNAENALATLLTGSNPFYHGIADAFRFDRKKAKVTPIFEDEKYVSRFGYESISPLALHTTTIADELKIATEGYAEVFSLGIRRNLAVIGGGHAADAVYWMDPHTGNWVSSSFYQYEPTFYKTYAKGEPLSRRIDKGVWTPLLDLSAYSMIPYQTREMPFRHMFGAYPHKERYNAFLSSALANEELTELALHFLENSTLGSRQYPDMLTLSFTAAHFTSQSVAQCPLEIQDTYLRLDADLGRLLSAVDKKVGMENVLIILTSTYSETEEEYIPDRLNINTGNYYPHRGAALLNMYLSSLYGAGQWVEGSAGAHIYLNHSLLEEQKLSLQEVQLRATEFMSQLAGVQRIFPSYQLLYGTAGEEARAIGRGYHPKTMGDLIVEVQPGWKLQNDEDYERNRYQRKVAVNAPFVFYGLNIKPEHIHRTIKASEIAPTIAFYLRIRSPNGAQNKPIKEVIKRESITKTNNRIK